MPVHNNQIVSSRKVYSNGECAKLSYDSIISGGGSEGWVAPLASSQLSGRFGAPRA